MNDNTAPCNTCLYLHHNQYYFNCRYRKHMRCCGHTREQFAQEAGVSFSVPLRSDGNMWPYRFDPSMITGCGAYLERSK